MKAILVALNDDYSDVPDFPPIGSAGDVVSGPDGDGDYDILFPDWPCLVGDPCWVCHKSMLVLIDDDYLASKNLNFLRNNRLWSLKINDKVTAEHACKTADIE